MSTAVAKPIAERGTAATVCACYDLMTVAPACDITDFTDGKYLDDASPQLTRTAYLAAQQRQAEYLLDEARCGRGTQLLDIGCGYGRILEHAARRGADAVGITVSLPQVMSCKARGLRVFELNYRDAVTNPPLTRFDQAHRRTPYKGGEFVCDAIIANGSLEHFVQVDDAAAGRAGEIYKEFFSICRQLVVEGGRLVTTAIHFRSPMQFDPIAIAAGPNAHRRGSAEFQYAMLVNVFGGWYPEPGQLEGCADGQFELIREEDGTRDYHLTSEYWFRQFRRRLSIDPRVWRSVAQQLWRHPRAAWRMLQLQIWDQSWAWQFRPPAPMRLLRQTWVAKGGVRYKSKF
jgi:cyclopropane fatty-acyl-phospholipid synthase-like methyltransferase